MSPEVAFADLYRTHYRRVFELCRQLLGTVERAEDAAQEVFMRAHRHIDRFDETKSFAAWIATIARNHCIDVLRRERRQGEHFGDEQGERLAAEAEAEADAEAAGRGALGDLLTAERAAEVKAAVASLPEPYRVPLVLAYFGEHSYDEIAASLGLTRSHVGVLICRAKQKLRTVLAVEPENDNDLS